MRKLMVVLLAMLVASGVMAATGWYQDYMLVSLNGGADAYYWIGTDPSFGTQFDGANLGSIWEGETLDLGTDMKYWADGAARDGGAYYWTIDAGSATEMIWTQTYIGGNDFRGNLPSVNNIANGLDAGSHTLTVWSKSWGSEGDSWLNNGGNNYNATFTIAAIPEPTTIVLLGFGVAGLLVYSRRHS